METEVREVIAASRGCVIAPAGCGKTELIARAVAAGGGRKQLVLTHTHAGVRALLTRLKKVGAPSGSYSVETICGWALKYASAFPVLSGLGDGRPPGTPYDLVVQAAVNALAKRSIRKLVQTSYAGIYVDEYQDCVIGQHQLVLALAEILPCRVFGDPMQGIFGFRDNPIVDWGRDVRPNFTELLRLATPWRWRNTGREEMGAWLLDVRACLATGKALDLSALPAGCLWTRNDIKSQLKVCFESMSRSGTIVAIHHMKNQCVSLTQRLRGGLTHMETVDCQDLMAAAEQIERFRGVGLIKVVIGFAAKCMTKVSTELKPLLVAFGKGKAPSAAFRKKYPQIVAACASLLEQHDLTLIRVALDAIGQLPGSVLYRRELWREMGRTLHQHQAVLGQSLRDTAWFLRDASRHYGRRIESRIVSRTLLVKGLEFDHAIVLDADQLDAQNLYVAMTRGASSLHIMSSSSQIKKAPPKGI